MPLLLLVMLLASFAGCSSAPPPPPPPPVKEVDNTVAFYFERAPRRPDVAAYPPVREHVLIPPPEGRTFVTVRVVNYARPKVIPAPVFTPAPPSATAPVISSIESVVLFEFDLFNLTPTAQAKLDALVASSKGVDTADWRIEAHTDSIGSEQVNKALSVRRAHSVRDYLVTKGASPTRISSVGMGESHPVASNSTPEGRAQNRRAEVVVDVNTR